jgi:hypothetical protein
MKQPTPFLEVLVKKLSLQPGLTALCAGYETGEWRYKQLAKHLIEWLPEFALTYSELKELGAHNAVPLLAQAAKSVYTSEKYQKRGELGELLLHIVLRQTCTTVPAISKYYFKDSPNDTVKGFDAVHVVATPKDLELWLGEVKFYDDIQSAIRDVTKEINAHLERDYLHAEFTAITNKIDPAWPHAKKLAKLLHKNTSLDQVFTRVCVPALLTYDSPTVAGYKESSAAYRKAFESEVLKNHTSFSGKKLPANIQVRLFLIPLRKKKDLVKAFDGELKRWQSIG